MKMVPLPVCATLENPPDLNSDEDLIDDMHVVNQHIGDSSSESEDDIPIHNGYELLPQEIESETIEIVNDTPPDTDTEGINLEISSINQNSSDHQEQPDITANPESIQLWNETRTDSQPMDHDHIEKIKEAMAGFALPSSAVPAWAATVPEEEWKAHLFSRIKALQTLNNNEKPV